MQYIAPELLEGKRASPQSDVFSLGVTMFELLTRSALFLDESPYLTINNVLTRKAPSLSNYRDDVPPGLDEILQQALAKDPTQRFRNAEDLHRALNQYISRNFPMYSSTELGRAIQYISKGGTDSHKLHGLAPAAQHLGSQATHKFTIRGLTLKSRLRKYATGLAASVIIGTTMAFGYLSFAPNSLNKGGYLATAPIAKFVADDITTSTDGRVTKWPGQSQLGPVAFEQPVEQNKPFLVLRAIGDHAAVRFDGSQFMTNMSVAQQYAQASQATFIVVAKINPDHIGYLIALQQADKNLDVFRLGTDDSNHIRVKTIENPASRLFLTTETKYPSEYVVISVVMDSGAVQIHLNGSLLIPGSLLEPVAFGKSAIMTVGMEYDIGVPSDFFNGEIAEILFFDSCLNEFYRGLVEENLSAKYGIKRTSGHSKITLEQPNP
jgi:hypothetical protein